MKKLFLIIILLILFTFPIKASEEADWLVSQTWTTIEEKAHAVLALKTESTKYSSQISSTVAELKTNLDTCIQNNECNVKEATLSILAMKGTITNLDTYSTWLLNSRSIQYSAQELTGWIVQIVSPVEGTCVLTNTETAQEQLIDVDITLGYTPWVDIDSNVLTTNTKDLKLDCSSLQSSNLILSLIQKKTEATGTVYYIKQEDHNPTNGITIVELGNPCWGIGYRQTCDKDTTALVLYTLKQAGKIADSTWLKQQSLTPLQNAYLYKTTSTPIYFDNIKNSQKPLGDWDPDIYTTAMIAYLIKPSSILTQTKDWIIGEKNPSNCWPRISCDIKTTSAVLMSGITTTPSGGGAVDDEDNDNIPDSWEDDNCYGDCDPADDPDEDDLTNYEEYLYDTDPYEDDTDGDGYTDKEEVDARTDPLDPEDYPTSETGETLTAQRREACPEGDFCYTIYNCPGTCDSFGQCIDTEGDGCPESDTEEAPSEEGYPIIDTGTKKDEVPEEEGHGVLFWFLLVLLLLIALGGGGYLAYKKGLLKFKFKKKPSKRITPVYSPKLKSTPRSAPSYKPQMHHRKSPVRKHMEKALEKSMKEMEDLLKGK